MGECNFFNKSASNNKKHPHTINMHLYSFLPIAGGIIGAITGSYVRNKSPKRKRLLLFAWFLFFVTCILLFIFG